MKKGSIEAMQVKEFTTDFINWALTHHQGMMDFLVGNYTTRSMRRILDVTIKQMINEFMNQKLN